MDTFYRGICLLKTINPYYLAGMKKIATSVVALLLFACGNEATIVENESHGYAQGSTYQIKYITEKELNLTAKFDSIFKAVDQSMSTYKKESIISRINADDSTVKTDALFNKVWQRSQEISEETNGLFDVTVGPLVELWGFGTNKNILIDSARVDSALALVGYTKVELEENLISMPAGFRIDFNSIAQGYTVDVIADFLESRGITRYMVEVGGEVRAKGKNSKDQFWKIGVDKPSEEIDTEDRFQMIVELRNKSLATSGNYRKFWVDEETGVKYAHTIDPESGYPARNQLLSVTIIADECMDADAYATACMVMGLPEAKEYIEKKEGVEAYFISAGNENQWEVLFTKGFESFILK